MRPAAPHRAEFDVDLGPDASTKALENAVQHDPLERIEIGPGGTFGLDPLEQLSRRKKQTAPPAPAPAEPEENFELHLEPAPEEEPEVEEADGELDALIGRAMANSPAPSAPGQEVSGEIRLDYPEQDAFATTLQVPAEPPAPPAAVPSIPTLGGSFDADDEEEDEKPYDPGRRSLERRYPGVRPVDRPRAGAADHHPRPPPRPNRPARQARCGSARRWAIRPARRSPPHPVPPRPRRKPRAWPPCSNSRRYSPTATPSLNLFNANHPEDESGAAREMKRNADILVNTLDSFGVKTRILDICRGPSVTRYELQPQAGIKVSRITSLADDIALNLATAGVRIEAPIPGKPAVGIEVPNKIRSTVNIRGVFEAQNYINMRSPLTMALGKDIAGQAQVADLCKMPHLLIAGSTGSGKSVCVNSIIISFLFRSGPEDVKLILIDPKVVELAEYNGIPHLLMPVVTEPRKAAGALGASVAEMERRYKLFAENNVRDIKSYNKLAKQNPVLEHLPYIAIIIDELADLMMVAGKEVEDYICRIAQKARAAGIHLIVATQRRVWMSSPA